MDSNSRRELRFCYGDKRVCSRGRIVIFFTREKELSYILIETDVIALIIIIIVSNRYQNDFSKYVKILSRVSHIEEKLEKEYTRALMKSTGSKLTDSFTSLDNIQPTNFQ